MTTIIRMAVFTIVYGTTPCLAQSILLDDFSAPVLSPNWFPVDTNLNLDEMGMPIGPKPWGPGIFDTTSGALNMRTTGVVPATPGPFDPENSGFMAVAWAASAVDPTFSNGSLRAKVRIDTGVTASLNLRTDLATFSAYNFAASELSQFGISLFENGVGTPLGAISDLPFRQGEDWWIEASSIGNQHSMKVWRDGSQEPLVAQLVVHDSTLTQGLAGLGTGLGGGTLDATMVSATFDDVTFTVPEPNSILSLTIGLLCLLRLRRSKAVPGNATHQKG